jgi:hypothetical protein
MDQDLLLETIEHLLDYQKRLEDDGENADDVTYLRERLQDYVDD